MKNDLTSFEKDLLKSINIKNKTQYTYKNLMEWCSDKKAIEVRDGEIMYEAFGCYVVIDPSK